MKVTDAGIIRAMEIIKGLPPYKSRSEPRLKKYIELERANEGEGYSWLINDWIPSEPDAENLMDLFILLGFSTIAFVEVVTTGSFDTTAARVEKDMAAWR